MSPLDVHDLLDEVTLLDVREPDEWRAGHAPGATHIPLQQLPARLRDVPREARLAVICRTGSRSQLATEWLRRQGYDASNVSGGMVAWQLHRLPIQDVEGRPGRVI